MRLVQIAQTGRGPRPRRPRSTPTCSARTRRRRTTRRAWCSSTSTGSDCCWTALRRAALHYLAVADIDATLARLRDAGVAVEGEPHVIFSHEDDTLGPADTDEWRRSSATPRATWWDSWSSVPAR